MAARRKVAAKGAKRSAKARPKVRARAKKPAKAAAPAIGAVAQKILRTMTRPGSVKLADLYTENATSKESGPMPPAVGLAAIEAKGKGFEAIVKEQAWKATHVWTGKNSVAIEWTGRIVFKNGRTLDLSEVAVHEIKNGKIAAERYYYDPAPFAAASQGAGASPPPPQSSPPRRPTPPPRYEDADDDEPAESIDPLDL
jgi:ketosteroid isomerase-like protein